MPAITTKKVPSTYRGVKLSERRKGLLKDWLESNQSARDELLKWYSEAMPEDMFKQSFMNIIEQDRLEAEKNGKVWPADYA